MATSAVYKHRLSNGMTVLTLPQFRIPKVSLQLWYRVGSKDESSREKGIAHLIEHMIFKGTTTLSESDINLITHKLAGYCNAFTSHDYTGYMFELPSTNWDKALPIMADCMVNCTFKEDLLNAELKAVIQELKMYKDDYGSILIEKLMGSLFSDHPYRYPVIGYKKDLWNLNRDHLVAFYKKHYIPNNATLIVTGAVKEDEVKERVEEAFSHLMPDWSYTPKEYYHSPDISSQRVVVYRDIQQPFVMVAWVVPGLRARSDYLMDVTASIIGSGKSSRLFKRLVDTEQIATDVEAMVYDLMDHALFIVHFQPTCQEVIEKAIGLIERELEELSVNGCTDSEFLRAKKKTELDWMGILEDQERCAFLLGKHYLATSDEQYLLHYIRHDQDAIRKEFEHFITTYLRPSVMHVGQVLPITEKEKPFWLQLQALSDKEDALVLNRIVRESEIEAGLAVHTVEPREWEHFDFPKYESMTLSNGLRVLYSASSHVPKISVIIDFKARGYYDPDAREGLQSFMMDMLDEGTARFPGHTFVEELESLGIALQTHAGQISMSMLSTDFPKALSLISSILTEALFEPKTIEKVRTHILADIKDYWDTPTQFIGQLAREAIYEGHPYKKSYLGTVQSINSIRREDLLHAYRAFITPREARLAIVGDFKASDLKNLLEESLGSWQGPEVPDIIFPNLVRSDKTSVNRYINRDQMVLAFAGLSVRRMDTDFDKLFLFDHVLTGGASGSMNSRLFQIRERSGLFYTIGGSLVSGAHTEPGMIFIKTIVSGEKAEEAELLIKKVLNKKAEDLTDSELLESQRAIAANLVDHFASNHQIANSFLFLDRFKLPATFFDTRAQHLQAIRLDEVQESVSRLLAQDLATFRVGRISG